MAATADPPSTPARRAAAGVIALAALAWMGACGATVPAAVHHRTPHAGVPPTSTTTTTPVPTSSTVPPPAVTPAQEPAQTLVATTNGAIAYSQTPGGPAVGVIPAQWNGAVSALPVIGSRRVASADSELRTNWFDVRLATRPNESTGWVDSDDVTVSTTPFHIVVNLSTTTLTLFDKGLPVLSFPAGVGSTADPTPPGHFFLALFSQSPSAGYGPFVMVTSAHSDQITDWEDSGDAIIAIHGPLGLDAEIGTTGAYISHGCVRLHIADLVQLRDVLVGSPIDIIGTTPPT